ncbi:MAG: hypothetical protein JXA87_14850 [Thermoleophilia bacterium]|nr:hypothetical protein [Thermoleophilia bacterium]
MDKEAAVWANQDTAVAREIYTNDAVVYMPVGGGDSDKISGIEEIVNAVKTGVNNQQYGDALTPSVPADEKALSPTYRGAIYVTQPSIATVGEQTYLFTVTLEVRDGKIVNQWITQMYRDWATSPNQTGRYLFLVAERRGWQGLGAADPSQVIRRSPWPRSTRGGRTQAAHRRSRADCLL